MSSLTGRLIAWLVLSIKSIVIYGLIGWLNDLKPSVLLIDWLIDWLIDCCIALASVVTQASHLCIDSKEYP